MSRHPCEKLQCLYESLMSNTQKNPKISPGAYIFQRPFLRGLFLEGLFSERLICVSKSIGLALLLEGNLPFLLCLLCI